MTFLLEAGGTSLVAYEERCVGGEVTRGWSDHAVNGDSISQEEERGGGGALTEQLKKPLAA